MGKLITSLLFSSSFKNIQIVQKSLFILCLITFLTFFLIYMIQQEPGKMYYIIFLKHKTRICTIRSIEIDTPRFEFFNEILSRQPKFAQRLYFNLPIYNKYVILIVIVITFIFNMYVSLIEINLSRFFLEEKFPLQNKIFHFLTQRKN